MKEQIQPAEPTQNLQQVQRAGKRLMNFAEARKALGVNAFTLAAWSFKQKLPRLLIEVPAKSFGAAKARMPHFWRADVEDFLAKHGRDGSCAHLNEVFRRNSPEVRAAMAELKAATVN